MSSSGKIIASNGKVLLSFGTATVTREYESFKTHTDYHIGVNLNTKEIDEIVDFYSVLGLHELSVNEQNTLVRYLPILHKLKQNVMTVSAKARSGKDYLAEYVIENMQGNIHKLALGDAIRDVRDALYGRPGGKDRERLIMIGQGLRKVDPNIWIKAWLRHAINLLRHSNERKLICPDVRQPNEFSFFNSMGALTVKIAADEEKRLNVIREIDGEAALDPKQLNDETESYVDGFAADITIENDYTAAYDLEIATKVLKALRERGW
jgi:hypothetical protein